MVEETQKLARKESTKSLPGGISAYIEEYNVSSFQLGFKNLSYLIF